MAKKWPQQNPNHRHPLQVEIDRLRQENAAWQNQNLLEQCNRQADEIERLNTAIRLDIEDAKATCGGDGLGCTAFRPYYNNPERRYSKCGQCPMGVLSNVREVSAA
jgi:hypothetical protein